MKFASLLTLIALLAACSSAPPQPTFRPLSDAVGRQTKSIETVLSIEQKALIGDINRATTDERIIVPLVGPLMTGIFKLADLGVNHSRKKTAKEALAPVHAALLNFNVNEVLRAALQNELKTVPWAGGGPVTVNTSDDDEVRERLYFRSRHAGFLHVSYEYRLTPTFDSLMIEVTPHLIPKASALRKIQGSLYEDSTRIDDRKGDKVQADNALYSQPMLFIYPLPERRDDLDANAAQWSNNDGELIRKALNDGATAIARVVAKSLNTPRALTPENASTAAPLASYTLDIEGTSYSVSQLKVGLGGGTTYILGKRVAALAPAAPAAPASAALQTP